MAGEEPAGVPLPEVTEPEITDAPLTETVAEQVSGREVVDLTEPSDGLPPVIAAPDELAEAVRRLAAGTGPVAVDAERASGYRYGQRAYLVQLRREGAGTMLIDPIACPDLSGVDAAL
ncbi:MAG TPA: ribonuclease D, partial [Trebonia sp.]|nr:ribonuclease D [Trebonia sp.]